MFPGEGGNVDVSFIIFQVANDAIQMDLHKTLHRFSTTKKIPKESTRSVRIFWNRIQVELYSNLWKATFWHPLQLSLNWGIIQYHYYSQLQTAESEWTWSIHHRVCGAHISLWELNLTFQNLGWNVFYALAIRNAFSFHKLLNIHFSSTFQKYVIISE